MIYIKDNTKMIFPRSNQKTWEGMMTRKREAGLNEKSELELLVNLYPVNEKNRFSILDFR